jgi:hypothetical protein
MARSACDGNGTRRLAGKFPPEPSRSFFYPCAIDKPFHLAEGHGLDGGAVVADVKKAQVAFHGAASLSRRAYSPKQYAQGSGDSDHKAIWRPEGGADVKQRPLEPANPQASALHVSSLLIKMG